MHTFMKSRATEAGKTSSHLGDTHTKSIVLSLALDTASIIHWLCFPCKKTQLQYIRDEVDYSAFKDEINEIEEKNPSTKNLAIMQLIRLIAENDKLRQESETLKDLAQHCNDTLDSLSHRRFYSQLNKTITDFNLLNLRDKIHFLVLLKEKTDFIAIQDAFIDRKWSFYDIVNDKNFKQKYINKAIREREEHVSQDFQKSIDKCIELAKQGEEIVSKYFEKKVAFQAYCEESDDTYRALNVNLINYDGSEPIRISDILQQEKDHGKLNIYRNKEHEVHAYQDRDKKRYYKFAGNACYEMTSIWPAKDESGRVLTCTMTMNIDSNGIIKIVRFNGENFESPSEEFWRLIKQNHELHIQGLLLYKAVEKFLEMQRDSGCEKVKEDMRRTGKNKGCEPESLPNVAPTVTDSSDGSIPTSPFANSDTLTPIEYVMPLDNQELPKIMNVQPISNLGPKMLHRRRNRDLENRNKELRNMLKDLGLSEQLIKQINSTFKLGLLNNERKNSHIENNPKFIRCVQDMKGLVSDHDSRLNINEELDRTYYSSLSQDRTLRRPGE